MKSTIQYLIGGVAVLWSASLMAIPTLDTIPTTLGPLPNLSDSQGNYFSVTDTDSNDDDISSFLLNRNAGNSNTVGIYDPFDITNTMVLWSGSTLPGFTSGVVLNWDGTSSYAIEGGTDSLTLTNLAFGSWFGMYIDSTSAGGTNRWYSDPSLNPGGRDHLATFLTEGMGGATNAFDITFAWEDLDLGDEDYNDVIYGCIDCTQAGQPRITRVPAPGTMLLMGLGLLAFRFRTYQVD